MVRAAIITKLGTSILESGRTIGALVEVDF